MTTNSSWAAPRNPIFRRLWIASLISGTCVAAHNNAVTYMMSTLGASPLLIALISSVALLPFFLFTVPAGALGDRVNRKNLLCAINLWPAVRLIRSFGFRVEAFGSAEEFGNSGYLEKTACPILDVQMPGMDGLELQHRLSETGNRIPIVFITARADEVLERRAIEAGAVGFLYKPFSQESLLQAVRSAGRATRRNLT